MLLSAEMDASHFRNLSNNNSHYGPAGCFCSLRAERRSTLSPSTNTLQQPPAPRRFLPPGLPAALCHREHGPISSFLSATPERLGVVHGEVRQRQFSCYQMVPISEGSSTQPSAAKATAKLLAMPLPTSSRKIFSPGFRDFLFSAFLGVSPCPADS